MFIVLVHLRMYLVKKAIIMIRKESAVLKEVHSRNGLSYYVSQYFAYAAIGLWALIFFKDIFVKKENLFRNYRI